MAKKPILICLHGWGGSKESFTQLRTALKNSDVEILTPDLPGFGNAKEPEQPWTNNMYADWTEEWIRKKADNRPIYLLGHSHGGRIAMKLVMRSDLPIAHLFLCASAGIRHPRHLKRMIGLILSKPGDIFLSLPVLKKLKPIGRKLMYKLIRVHDYERASGIMRQTLLNVTREDFRNYLHKIRIPTDIFWGKEDRMTPYSDALIFHKGISGSMLHSFAGVRHAVHREKAREIAQEIISHL